MTLVQKEIKKIYVWKEPYTDYSAVQGPCSEGFHIPTKDEAYALVGIMNTLGLASCSNYSTYLKIPLSGRRHSSSGTVEYTGSIANLYTCELNDSGYPYLMSMTDGADSRMTESYNMGFNIRPFKNGTVIPDSSRTALYSDKIYYNSTLQLISLTSDGTNWITISDRNLGATTAGTSTNAACCGNFYQRGNNYGFPFSGGITSSTTQVDPTGYGPGNYYSSSTFIKNNNGQPYNPINKNLRGGETGITQGGGDIQIRPKLS